MRGVRRNAPCTYYDGAYKKTWITHGKKKKGFSLLPKLQFSKLDTRNANRVHGKRNNERKSDRPAASQRKEENRQSLERKNARGDPRFPNGTNRVLGRKGFFFFLLRSGGPEKSLNRVHGWLSGVIADGFCGLWRAFGPVRRRERHVGRD